VDSEKKRKLNETIVELQNRFGMQVIRRRVQTKSTNEAQISTTFPALDTALSSGGLPRGRISEIIGAPTSGMATIALRIMAKAQERGQTAVYIDPDHTFDPAYGALLGIELDRMILVRPYDLEQALAILRDFILGGSISLLIFDLPYTLISQAKHVHILGKTLERIVAPLGQSKCILLFLSPLPALPASQIGKVGSHSGGETPSLANYPTDGALPHFASVRLLIRRESWIYRERDIRGYQAVVQVIKNKLGPAGQEITIELEVCDEL
jgi:recombination protein RecA